MLRCYQQHCFRILLALVSVATTPAIYANDCQQNLPVFLEKMSFIEEELKKTITKDDYVASVTGRYEDINQIMEAADECSQQKQMPKVAREQWKELANASTLLHANARECAFKEFENWVSYKSSDMEVLSELTED